MFYTHYSKLYTSAVMYLPGVVGVGPPQLHQYISKTHVRACEKYQGRLAMGGMEANASIFGLGGIFFRLGDVKISLRGDFSMTQGGCLHDPGGDRRP